VPWFSRGNTERPGYRTLLSVRQRQKNWNDGITLARRIPRLTLAFALVSLGGCLRCGGHTQAPSSLSESEYPDRFVAASCAQVDDCCRSAGYASSSECSSPTRSHLLDQIADAQAAGATYDPTAAAECIGTFATRCADLESGKTARNDGPCSRVYVRAKNGLGMPCLSDWSCPAGSRCGSYLSGNVAVRVCQSVTLRNEGEACGEATPDHAVDCLPPLRCDSRTCKYPPEIGDPCNGVLGDTCAPGSMCDRLGTQHCIVPPRAAGTACTAPEQCEGYRCNNGRCLPLGSLAGSSNCTP
jgi:hypothetical protein